MTTTPQMNLVLPSEGGSSNVWDVILDTAFGLIDSHGHVTGQGVPIVSAALNINADVSWAGNAISHLKALYLTEQSAAPLTNDAIFALSSDHNLYFRNSSGVNVQITSGNTLNVSIVGGIGGDYSSVGALLSYDDATRRFLLQQEGSPRPWAGLATADIDLYQKAASITNKVTLKSPNSLAASYSLTMPTALPASTSIAYISSSGQIAYTPPDRVLIVHPSSADLNSNIRGQLNVSFGMNEITTAAGNTLSTFPIHLPVGSTVKSVIVYVNKSTASTTTLLGTYQVTDMTSGATTVFSQTNATNAPGYTTISGGNLASINTAITATTSHGIAVGASSGAGTGDLILGIAVTYTPPI